MDLERRGLTLIRKDELNRLRIAARRDELKRLRIAAGELQVKEFNKLQETAKSVERLAVAGMPYSACVELGNLAHDLLQAESISDAKGAALLKSTCLGIARSL